MNSINININNTGIVVGTWHFTTDKETGVRTEGFSTGSKGWYANGKVNVTVGAARGPLTLTIEGQTIVANPRPMTEKSGNFGWFANGKVNIDGKQIQVSGNITACKCGGVEPLNQVATCQVGLNLVVVGSKSAETKPAAKKSNKKAAPATVAAKTENVPTVNSTPHQMTIAELQAALNALMAKSAS